MPLIIVQNHSSDQVQTSIKSSTKRQNRCSKCGALGHYAKKCTQEPQCLNVSGSMSSASSNAVDPVSVKKRTTDKESKNSKKKSKNAREIVDSDEESVDGRNVDELEMLERHNYDGGDDMNESDNEENDEGGMIIDLTEEDWTEMTGIEELPAVGLRDMDYQKTPEQCLPTFTGRHVGSQVNKTAGMKKVVTPSDFFQLFFDSEILTRFVEQTNSYAKNTSRRAWRDTDEKELKTFLSIILYMGINKKPQRFMHWDDSKFQSPWVSNMMAKTRFEELLRIWHWTDTTQMTKEEYIAEKNRDPFFTIKSFCDKLSSKFSHWYNLGQRICIDESCFAYKGRHKCRCYNPHKPHKWHFKAFCLNCSDTGYLHSFFLYQGKDEDRSEFANCSATEYPVRRLMSDKRLCNKNHLLATDNWYTSVVLAIFLLSIGVHFLGTCKSNKKYIPKRALYKRTGKNKKERGVFEVNTTDVDVVDATSGRKSKCPIYFTSWMDNKPVHMVSTFETFKTNVVRVHKTKKGRYEGKKEINIPSNVVVYNRTMGGTDLADQMLSYYYTFVKTKRLHPRIFIIFLALFRGKCPNTLHHRTQ